MRWVKTLSLEELQTRGHHQDADGDWLFSIKNIGSNSDHSFLFKEDVGKMIDLEDIDNVYFDDTPSKKYYENYIGWLISKEYSKETNPEYYL